MKYFLIFAILFVLGCGKKEDGSKPAQNTPPSITQGESATKSIAGVTWSVPSEWKELPAKQMRVATYEIPAAGDDEASGECAVFFFGTGEGGDVESNIARWLAQFESATDPERSVKEIDGLTVNLVDLTGVFLAPGGPAMQSQGKKDNYRLLGAIVEAPEGRVFFKATGPAETMSAGKEAFDKLIGSLTAQ